MISGAPNHSKLVLAAGLCLALGASVAEARCPRSAVGIYSGLSKLDSFGGGVGHNDSGTGLIRVILAADGTYTGEFDSKNSEQPNGESGTLSGTYRFDAGRCAGEFMLGGNPMRFRLTDSGRILNAILYTSSDASEQDVNSFQLFRE